MDNFWIVATFLSESERMMYNNNRSWGEASREPSPKRKIALISSIWAFTTNRCVTCWMKTVAGKGTRSSSSEPRITFIDSDSEKEKGSVPAEPGNRSTMQFVQATVRAANKGQRARTTAGNWMQGGVLLQPVKHPGGDVDVQVGDAVVRHLGGVSQVAGHALGVVVV